MTTMTKGRLEAFSDGVIAIIITIMVLELKVPADASLGAIMATAPTLVAYIISYIFIGIYWSNHHHLIHATNRVNGAILWANLHLLFWLSLVPYATNWFGRQFLQPTPTAFYGFILFMAAIGYWILLNCILAAQGRDTPLGRAVGGKRKEIASLMLYVVALALAFYWQAGALAIYLLVACIWLIPDRRIERALAEDRNK